MDKLKDLAGKATGGSGSSSGGAGGAGKEDYGDKGKFIHNPTLYEQALTCYIGLDAVEKKMGMSQVR